MQAPLYKSMIHGSPFSPAASSVSRPREVRPFPRSDHEVQPPARQGIMHPDGFGSGDYPSRMWPALFARVSRGRPVCAVHAELSSVRRQPLPVGRCGSWPVFVHRSELCFENMGSFRMAVKPFLSIFSFSAGRLGFLPSGTCRHERIQRRSGKNSLRLFHVSHHGS